jgi:hypothetical protein
MKHASTETPLLRLCIPVLFGVREINNRHRKFIDGKFKLTRNGKPCEHFA